jgi:DNA-3-methyladenine glycosylase I
MSWGYYRPYVSVAKRKTQAARKAATLKKKGQILKPVIIEGRTIAKTFWGKAWCDNLESYSDYENRLPRGRTYVRNGSVIDLQVNNGEISALVSGSSIYKINISISSIISNKWKNLVSECSGKIESLIELLQGKFSKGVMEIITHPEKGLFPHPKEIKLSCSCPDWADMCKHVAAVLYGIGARLDERPEELFLLRQADHFELLAKASITTLKIQSDHDAPSIADSDLSALFGIEIEQTPKKIAASNKSDKEKINIVKKRKSSSPPRQLVSSKQRCAWVTDDPLYIDYHDKEWGVPIYDDRLLFEFLILEGAQAGLSWITVLKKRENYRSCFDNFDPEVIARYSKQKIEKLLKNPGIIRNRLKVESVVTNAKVYLQVVNEYKNFSNYIWSFTDGEPINNNRKQLKHVPTKTVISDNMSKDLKKRGFKFVGSTICYAFMQAVGMVNDHTINCFRCAEVSRDIGSM